MTGPVGVAGLLMSRLAAEAFGPRIGEVLDGVPFRILALEDAADGQPVDLAFLTRDVTADSGKTVLAPTLARFHGLLRGSPRLQWVQTHTAGTDRPIFAELQQRGVRVTTGSGTAAASVAVMAVTGLLALARRLPALMQAQQRRAWEPLHASAPKDLADQTVAVVGLGPIGLEIARLCQALGLRIIGVSRSARTAAAPLDHAIAYGQLDAVLAQLDAIVLACPLSDSTRGLLDARRLALLPAGALVVNVARGDVIVEPALVAALARGHLGGAFLDVFVREPLEAESALWGLPNVIVSPHTAAHTRGQFESVGRLFLDNLARWRRGAALRNVAEFSRAGRAPP